MAKVLASIKIFPNDANIDLSNLKSKVQASLPTGSTVEKFEEEPVAFGLVALIAHVVLPEDEQAKWTKSKRPYVRWTWLARFKF